MIDNEWFSLQRSRKQAGGDSLEIFFDGKVIAMISFIISKKKICASCAEEATIL